ncbi:MULTISPECIES: MptD family putative ECF transporter S component [unclassified Gemella]|uniref:MptD family putative ECF transporter S component n=1 Tax=unclassified Gemella TaxID=2624949 RepID=UPI001073D6CA|nr:MULTISPECIES: MptD family putative ECF transporter S component [unclassified Gemella]MBF0709645.1 MptD family putative ECF transporter S component [Gemella sp. GL1.1]MBF0746936.1 MptD family putative ECF transporter S component [Gemella sp. 19428wG2_WT2a]NYS26989.1 MptD family putative ECF transporter S component [Gemella sp. GL1]TFU59162.1 Trep_Strep domain-containing protein [Gemella sp. WT2a]
MTENLKYIKKEEQSKLNIKDLITLGLYNLLIILLMGVGVGVCAAFFSFAFNGQYYFAIFTTVGTGLFAAPAFSLIFNKIKKKNAILITTLIQAVFLLLSGHAAIAFFITIVAAILAEYFFRKNNEYLSYLAYTFGGIGAIIPVYFMKDSYIQHLRDKEYSQEKIDFIMHSSSLSVLLAVVIATVILTLLGTYIGRKIYFKNFDKAGI